ncbi:Formate/nitrite transporter [Decorospora gaudefroyi]|uniref:Formate/nitrite transporter n=1 Tax=Decorospora gaudefroyi TaxID=184978 RepID=A0A6A5KFV1_9PLEO|nr:Formate/nitrite transporter [Decorospora gaudefroyi]
MPPRTLAPPNLSSPADAHTPLETLRLIEQAGLTKARLPLLDLITKSFLGGVFIALGSAFDLVVAGGAPSLRASNPSLATLLAALTFPIGFVIIILFNVELCTSNMFVLAYSTLRRRTSVWDLVRNWVVSYVFNIAGCLFYAGVLVYWSDTLSSPAQKSYAATGANARVNVNWAYNFTRGIMCNWLVGVAYFLATEARDVLGKIVAIWIPIWAFVAMGYQHSVANFLLVPVGLFYEGAQFGVGKFVWNSCVPVTLGNVVGGAFFMGFALWAVYGRYEPSVKEMERNTQKEEEQAEAEGV